MQQLQTSWCCAVQLLRTCLWNLHVAGVVLTLGHNSYRIQYTRMLRGNEENVKGVHKCFLLLQVLLLCWNAMVPKKNSCNTICHTTNLHIWRGKIWKCFTDYYSPHKAVDSLLIFLTKLTSAYGLNMDLGVLNCH